MTYDITKSMDTYTSGSRPPICASCLFYKRWSHLAKVRQYRKRHIITYNHRPFLQSRCTVIPPRHSVESEHRMGVHCHSTIKPAAEAIPELNLRLCKVLELAGWATDAVMLHHDSCFCNTAMVS